MTATDTKSPEKEAADTGKGGRKKLLIIVVVALLVLGAVYWNFFKPSGPKPPPEPGEIVAIDPTQINLADGRYLRLGLALQLTTAATEGGDGSKALDAAIDIFSGKRLDQVEGQNREKLKDKLVEEVERLYEGEVMDVYFTEFVTQ